VLAISHVLTGLEDFDEVPDPRGGRQDRRARQAIRASAICSARWRLLDLVGLDAAQAIGRTIDVPVPARVNALVAEGALGRKSGRGLYSYDE
jgi:3-hydroxyacyl-CoA dehydrogenase